jgi:hypothetical protein
VSRRRGCPNLKCYLEDVFPKSTRAARCVYLGWPVHLLFRCYAEGGKDDRHHVNSDLHGFGLLVLTWSGQPPQADLLPTRVPRTKSKNAYMKKDSLLIWRSKLLGLVVGCADSPINRSG